MAPAHQYRVVPHSPDDLDDNEFKDKPALRRRGLISLLLRKLRKFCRPAYLFVAFVVFLLLQVTFNASYIQGPPFELNRNETVFIAANIIDQHLIDGIWGNRILELVDLIGPERTFVSIYGGPKEALQSLEAKLPKNCGRSIISEKDSPIKLKDIPHTTLPTGEERIKRIAFLAEVRNKALEPLKATKTRFDRVLFINDVVFEAKDATRLLWGTNLDAEGNAHYKAACGTDFVTSWKYYDTYATRDLEGYSIGVPIFPWFANVGNDAQSRRDVLAGRDAVRVKSCWGGIVAFDGRYFQDAEQLSVFSASENPKLPLRFRSEPDPFWDASECCLIHADIMALPPLSNSQRMDSVTRDKPFGWEDGIFMNPYVRVSYDEATFKWIPVAKRFERLFAVPQDIINRFASMPRFNYRRSEREGDKIKDRKWVSAHKKGSKKRATLGGGDMKGKEYWAHEGHYEEYERTATRGGYCGVRQLLVLKKEDDKSEGNWDNLLNQVPPLDV
ncbi:cryptococcal mannosyltransferase 1-domain-containing protein [Bisporella sp. PMI_857]|nr:cryptococcal mannosyltransferase 1-domain-containing protein [Bisporella sp. PMI_857]